MANLKNIRTQIKSVTSIQKVTKAMKMVAAAKLRKSQDNMEKARPYSQRIKNLIGSLINDVNRDLLPLLRKPDTIETHGFVVITSDRGLAGSFNTNIIKRTEEEIMEIGKENAFLLCVGKKGFEHFNKRDYNIINNYQDFWNNLNYSHAIDIGKDITDAYIHNKINKVNIIYNYFKNVGSQKIKYDEILPLEFDNSQVEIKNDILYEPSKTQIVKTLVPKYFNTQIWQFLLESFAGEQAARMVAMENATENAKDMISELNLQFNKARQSAITTEMLEIVGGAEALAD